MNALFTLGYEKKNINEFIDILVKSKIKILVDVRETAWSYKRDFCKSKFTSALAEHGITYIHVNKAGNPKALRRKAKSRSSCLEDYRKYLRDTESGIDDLESILVAARLENEAVCLTCYEREHVECHRSIIVDYLEGKVDGLSVKHLA